MATTTTYTCNKDARIASSGSLHLGAGSSVSNPFGTYSGYRYRTLMGFSISMTGWISITSAILHVRTSTQDNVAFGSDPNGLFQRLTGAWSEGSGTGLSSTNAVVDPGPAATGTNNVLVDMPTTEGTWVTADVTAMMRDVLAGGAFTGIRILGVDNAGAESSSSSNVGEIYSREGGSAPYIVITYETNRAPNAPTISSSGVTSGLSGSQTPPVAITVTDPDADALTQYRWQIDNNSDFSSPAQDLTVSGSFASGSVQTVTPASLTRGTTYYVRAQAYDGQVWGAWSATFSFKVASAPVVTITEPSATGRLAKLLYTPGSGWNSPRLVTNWTFSCPDGGTQKTYRVELLNDPGSSTVNDSGTVTDTAARTRTVPFDLTESSYYQVRITCVCSHGVTTVTGPYRVRARWGVVTHRFDMTVAVGSLSLSILDVTDETSGGSGHVSVEYNTTTTTAAPASYVGSISAAGLNRYFWYRAWLLAWGASPAVSPTLNELKINYTTTSFVIVPDLWTRQDPVNAFGDTSSFVFGTQSLKMLGKGVGTVNNVYQQVPVVPNTDYILSGRVAAQGAAGAAILLSTTGIGGGLVATPAVNNTLFTDPGSRVQTLIWNSGSATSVFIRCTVNGAVGTAAWFDALKLEASTVVTPWSPGYIAPAVVLDAGGLQIDGAAGGILRYRGDAQGVRDVVEGGVHGLLFGGDIELSSPVSGTLDMSPAAAAAYLEAVAAAGQRAGVVAKLAADTSARSVLYGDASLVGLELGAGNAVRDTNLYRSAANQLKTDDALQVTGLLNALGAFTAAGLVTASAGFTLGSGVFTAQNNLLRMGGTAFPASPATNDLFWRTDLTTLFYWSGTLWLDVVTGLPSTSANVSPLIQFGVLAMTFTAALTYTQTLTFPKAFTGVPVVLFNVYTASGTVAPIIQGPTASSVVLGATTNTGTGTLTAGAATGGWIAIGAR